MKKAIRTALVAVFVFGGFNALPSFSFSAFTPLHVSIALPAASVDLSDLDLRDENNRPIQSPSRHREVEQLFTNSLNDLLVNNLTPIKRGLTTTLAMAWNVLHGWWSIVLEKTCFLGSVWFKDKKLKRPWTSIAQFRWPDVLPTAGVPAQNSFSSSSLLTQILSSTILLR